MDVLKQDRGPMTLLMKMLTHSYHIINCFGINQQTFTFAGVEPDARLKGQLLNFFCIQYF